VKGYQHHALVAHPVTPKVSTRSYRVTTVVPCSVQDQLVTLQFGSTTIKAARYGNKLPRQRNIGIKILLSESSHVCLISNSLVFCSYAQSVFQCIIQKIQSYTILPGESILFIPNFINVMNYFYTVLSEYFLTNFLCVSI